MYLQREVVDLLLITGRLVPDVQDLHFSADILQVGNPNSTE